MKHYMLRLGRYSEISRSLSRCTFGACRTAMGLFFISAFTVGVIRLGDGARVSLSEVSHTTLYASDAQYIQDLILSALNLPINPNPHPTHPIYPHPTPMSNPQFTHAKFVPGTSSQPLIKRGFDYPYLLEIWQFPFVLCRGYDADLYLKNLIFCYAETYTKRDI